jgi:outer membrane immunogenic protein
VSGLGEVGGRVGYTVTNQALLYLRGGAAFEHDRYGITTQAANLLLATASENRVGGFVGVGFEYLFTQNISVFGEYDYVDMGTRDISFASTAAPRIFTTQSIRERKDVVKVGLNYRFNLAQPVVAKY